MEEICQRVWEGEWRGWERFAKSENKMSERERGEEEEEGQLTLQLQIH